MKNIKLIAVDLDGVVIEDIFTQVLHIQTKKYGAEYTPELEYNTISQRREDSASYAIRVLGSPTGMSIEQILEEFYKERENFLVNGENPLNAGVIEFLDTLKSLNVKLVCYGGLEENLIDLGVRPVLEKYFERYICTDAFRPGLKEIVKDIHGLEFSEVLFIDDVNRMAEEAKKYKIPFIGAPAQHSWGFQKKEMEKTGVKYIVNSINEITLDYLEKVDSDKEIW